MSMFHVMCKTSEVTVFLSVFFGSIPRHPASKIYNFGERVSFRVQFSRDFSRLPQRENLLAGYLRTFIRQSLLKLRIVKERAPENEPRIQLGVNSLKVDTYQTCLYITGVSLQICLLIGPASAPYSFSLRLIFSPFIFSFIASEIKICFRYLNHSQ